jgi:[ribosomal protein S5]-alanine N-acetyltransferase
MQLAPRFPWRTNRVELFVLEPEHVGDAYVSWLRDPQVTRFLESRFGEHTQQSVRDFVSRTLADPNALMFGIRALAGSQHVGNIKIGPIDLNHGLGEIGLMIGARDAWGRGFGSDAIELVFRIATEQLSLRKLTAGCYAANLGSLRAFQKAGFHLEAVRKAHFLLEGRAEDLLLLARHHVSSSPSTDHGFQK